MEIQYMAGLYCRLSKDDEHKGESVSIGTQRAILTEFCLQNNYDIFKIYVDDGYSGLNFERPAFQELLRDVEAGLVNMVITKDFSRLGRTFALGHSLLNVDDKVHALGCCCFFRHFWYGAFSGYDFTNILGVKASPIKEPHRTHA